MTYLTQICPSLPSIISASKMNATGILDPFEQIQIVRSPVINPKLNILELPILFNAKKANGYLSQKDDNNCWVLSA
jgi:hypothetical protein